MNCRPSPARPPRPQRASPSSVSNTPPASGLRVIADRSASFRVPSVTDSSNARSHARATSMLNRHASARPVRDRRSARVLVIRTVVPVRIDRGGARLWPHAWFADGRRDRSARRASTTRDRRISSRCRAVRQLTLRPVGDETSHPSNSRPAKARPIPGNDAPGRARGTPAKTTIVVSCGMRGRIVLTCQIRLNDVLHPL